MTATTSVRRFVATLVVSLQTMSQSNGALPRKRSWIAVVESQYLGNGSDSPSLFVFGVLLDQIAKAFVPEKQIGTGFPPQIKVSAHDSVRFVGTKFRRRIWDQIPASIKDEPVCAGHIGRQS